MFLFSWVALGLMVGVYWSRTELVKKSELLAREEIDLQTTVSFLKRTMLFDPTAFVNPDSEEIQKLAQKLRTPQEIYDWMKNEIYYDPSAGLPSDLATLQSKKSSCYGFAAVVTSLLRANGFGADQVHVTVAELNGKDNPPHAWAEALINDEWYVIDPTSFVLQNSYFADRPVLIMKKDEYLDPWPKKNIIMEYNDEFMRFDIDN